MWLLCRYGKKVHCGKDRPKGSLSTEVQSTDVVILSLLELRWLHHQMKALPCSPEAHGIVHQLAFRWQVSLTQSLRCLPVTFELSVHCSMACQSLLCCASTSCGYSSPHNMHTCITFRRIYYRYREWALPIAIIELSLSHRGSWVLLLSSSTTTLTYPSVWLGMPQAMVLVQYCWRVAPFSGHAKTYWAQWDRNGKKAQIQQSSTLLIYVRSWTELTVLPMTTSS